MKQGLRVGIVLAAVAAATGGAIGETVAIPYRVKQENGQVSLVLYDQQGRLVRTLLTGKPHFKGKHAVEWDGTDRYGNPLPVGKYTWKLLETKGLTAEFLLQVGQNPLPRDARGVGNHGAPGSAVADDTGVYFAGTTEGAHTLGKTDRDGKYLWTSNPAMTNWGAHRGVAMALLDGKLYELNGDGLMYGVATDTGLGFTDHQHAAKPWNLNRPGTTNTVTGHQDMAADPTNKLLVVSYFAHNALAWFDPAQKGKQVDELTGLEKPAGVAVTADGTVLVISQGAVWSLTHADKTLKPVIPAAKLNRPWRLDVHPVTGDILVAENSDEGVHPCAGGTERHHQILRFSAAGELIRTYGAPGGRRDGPFVATDFRGINDLSFDPAGGFLVCEGPWTPPRRTVRLGDDGRVLHEWFGGQAYGTLATPEPNDPTHVWMYGNAPKASGLFRCRIDFESRTWRVVETYWDVFLDSPLGNITPNFLKITDRGGRRYVYSGTQAAFSIAVYDPVGKTLRPSNHSGRQQALPRELVPEEFRGEWDSYIWNDLNDDGQAALDELVWMHRPLVGGYLDPADFTLYLVGLASAFHDGMKIAPRRFTAGGTPVYDWADAQPYPQKWAEDDVQISVGDLWRNPDGTWYGCFAATIPTAHMGWEAHGHWYFNSCSGMDRLVKWDKAWKPLWSVGRHSPDAEHEIGSTALPRNLSGTARGCVVWTDCSDVETAGPRVYTEDGLYVDELWRLHGDTSSEDVYGILTSNEHPTGRLYTDPETGRVFFYMITVAMGSTVYEIRGWDGWRRDQGTVRLKAPPPPLTFDGTGLRAVYYNRPDRSGAVAANRVEGPVYHLWNLAAPADTVNADNFSVRWRGTVTPPTTEAYKFEVETVQHWLANGPSRELRLWVDGRQLFDQTGGVSEQWIWLERGKPVDIQVEASWGEGPAIAKLCWETKTNDRRVILAKFLHPAAEGAESAPLPTRLVRPEHAAIEQALRRRPLDLIAHLPFDDGKGIHPVCHSDAPGAVVNLVGAHKWLDDGRLGGALRTEPGSPLSPAYVMLGYETALPATDYTVAFWFRTTAENAGLFCARRRSPYNAIWEDHSLHLFAGKLRFLLAGQEPIATTNAVNDGQWHHVATTVGGPTQDSRLYVDGELVGMIKLAVRERHSNRLTVDLGHSTGGVPGAKTDFDELRIYGRVLDGPDIQRLAAPDRRTERRPVK